MRHDVFVSQPVTIFYPVVLYPMYFLIHRGRLLWREAEVRFGTETRTKWWEKRVPRAAESNKTRCAGELNPFVAATSFCVARRRKSVESEIFAFRRFFAS